MFACAHIFAQNLKRIASPPLWMFVNDNEYLIHFDWLFGLHANHTHEQQNRAHTQEACKSEREKLVDDFIA